MYTLVEEYVSYDQLNITKQRNSRKNIVSNLTDKVVETLNTININIIINKSLKYNIIDIKESIYEYINFLKYSNTINTNIFIKHYHYLLIIKECLENIKLEINNLNNQCNINMYNIYNIQNHLSNIFMVISSIEIDIY